MNDIKYSFQLEQLLKDEAEIAEKPERSSSLVIHPV